MTDHSFFTYDPDAFKPMASALSPSLTSVADTMLTERHLGIFSPLEISAADFTKAYELPIGDHVEKNYKGLSYLSWPFAFRYLKEHFPSLYVAFEEKEMGWPVFGQEGCWLLRPYLTDGIKRTPSLVFPLMDNKHNALVQLNARSVSDNIQRASVKCIATFTGLGLKLYSGEDIPKADDSSPSAPAQQLVPKTAPAAKQAAPSLKEAIGGTSEDDSNGKAADFNGKAALLAFCKSNPFAYADERTSMKAGKSALESLGLSKGEDIVDGAILCNVISAMLTAWIKEKEITITKVAMTKDLDNLKIVCSDGIDKIITWVKDYVEGKK